MITFGFFNSSNGDRKYNADSIANFFQGLINDGIYDGVGDAFLVQSNDASSSLSLNVMSGRAYLNNKWIYNSTTEILNYPAVPPPGAVIGVGQKRKDAICLYVDESTRSCGVEIVYGTPSSQDVDPVIEDTSVKKYHCIAYVTINYGDETISDANIQNRRGVEGEGNSVTPFVNALVDHVDTENLIAQWEAQWEAKKEEMDLEYDDRVAALEEEAARARAAAEESGTGYFQVANLYMKNVRVYDKMADAPDGYSYWVQMPTPTYEEYPFRATILHSDFTLLGDETPEVYFSPDDVITGILASFAVVSGDRLYIYATERPDHDSGYMTIPNIILIKPVEVV